MLPSALSARPKADSPGTAVHTALHRSPGQWVYQTWDHANKVLKTDDEKAPMDHEALLTLLKELKSLATQTRSADSTPQNPFGRLLLPHLSDAYNLRNVHLHTHSTKPVDCRITLMVSSDEVAAVL